MKKKKMLGKGQSGVGATRARMKVVTCSDGALSLVSLDDAVSTSATTDTSLEVLGTLPSITACLNMDLCPDSIATLAQGLKDRAAELASEFLRPSDGDFMLAEGGGILECGQLTINGNVEATKGLEVAYKNSNGTSACTIEDEFKASGGLTLKFTATPAGGDKKKYYEYTLTPLSESEVVEKVTSTVASATKKALGNLGWKFNR